MFVWIWFGLGFHFSFHFFSFYFIFFEVAQAETAAHTTNTAQLRGKHDKALRLKTYLLRKTQKISFLH